MHIGMVKQPEPRDSRKPLKLCPVGTRRRHYMGYVSGTMDCVPLLWTKAATQGERVRPTGATVKPWSSRGERTQLWRMNLISFSPCPPISCSAFCWPNLRECWEVAETLHDMVSRGQPSRLRAELLRQKNRYRKANRK